MKKNTLFLALTSLITTAVFAEEEAVDLTKVTVTANKTEKSLAEVTS